MSARLFTYRDGRIRFDVEHGGAVGARFSTWGFCSNTLEHSSPFECKPRDADALRHARAELVRHAGKANAEEVKPVLEALDKAIEDALQGSLF